MKKIFLIFSFFLLFLYADEISKKTKNLKENERVQEQLNKKLEDLANDIINGEKKLKLLSINIDKLSDQTLKLEKNAKIQLDELKNLSNQNKELLKSKNSIENKLVALLARDFAYDLPIPQGYIESEESFIAFEVIKGLENILDNDISKISKDYESINKLINQKQEQIDKINYSLKNYNTQLAKLKDLKLKQIEEINKQKTYKNIYTKKLQDLKAQQDELRVTLNKLKIIEKQKEQEMVFDNEKIASSNQNIRQIGSSYQESNVKRYSGIKTIAPLESFTIKQKFGNYIDPIYKIKIFNENVILTSNKKDAVVKAVFSGKIVFAKDTSMLDKVIILEHSNGIHTIYAHLDKIAPNVKVGKNVKKGAIIGRIKNDLAFEVTQKNFHINPLELISLN